MDDQNYIPLTPGRINTTSLSSIKETFVDEEQVAVQQKKVRCSPSRAWSYLKTKIEYLSMGKHNTKLYDEGKDCYSSVIGGLITVFSVSLLSILSLSILISCIKKENWDSDVTAVYFSEWEFASKSKGELAMMGLTFPIYKFPFRKRFMELFPGYFNDWKEIK